MDICEIFYTFASRCMPLVEFWFHKTWTLYILLKHDKLEFCSICLNSEVLSPSISKLFAGVYKICLLKNNT